MKNSKLHMIAPKLTLLHLIKISNFKSERIDQNKYDSSFVCMYECIYTHTCEHVFYIALKDAKCGDYNWLTEFCSSLKTDRTVAKIGPVHSAASDTFESNGFTSWHKTDMFYLSMQNIEIL